MSTIDIITIIFAITCFVSGYSIGRTNGFKEAIKMMGNIANNKKEN